MRVVAIVQARMGSSRLKNKVMQMVGSDPVISLLLKRLSRSQLLDDIVIATPSSPENLPLIDYVKSMGYFCVQGDESDVLGRYLLAAEKSKADIIVRITGDCPLVDPNLVDFAISKFCSGTHDYLSNIDPPTYPDGLDVEVFTYDALNKSSKLTNEISHREHVTLFLRESGLFQTENFSSSLGDYSGLRWTVDQEEDLEVISSICEYSQENIYSIGWEDLIELEHSNPSIFFPNKNLIRNEGMLMGTGQKLWNRAKKIIPGGNMLLSKRPEMFLPDFWPAYFSKAKDCYVWDLDGKKYTDISIMGIGTNTLGYGHPEVDSAVSEVIKNGNMSTLNCPEEVFLAEKLIELHPWAQMVKFARTGGEANAISVRIARAASGKDKIAICGYHGWHDWYLAANLGDTQSLDGHLLPGLTVSGVPRELKNTIYPFEYNNITGLKKIVTENEIGVIKMEVHRNMPPNPGFLEAVREIATKNGIVLIFDECTSGFRETNGGLHKKYGVNPDIAIFGKAIANGYALTAVIGKREVMESAQSTFISSTFWTERIGPTAALKTLDVMSQMESWRLITEIGSKIKTKWQSLADLNGLKINQWGLPALAGFSFDGNEYAAAYKTFITQEMLARGYLASNCIYSCILHSDEVLEGYFQNLNDVFGIIKKNEGNAIFKLLKGRICDTGFKRLN